MTHRANAYDDFHLKPGRAGQLRFDGPEGFVDEAEGHAAQIVLLGVLFRRCTIEHTADVLPPERLWAVLNGKQQAADAFETIGLFQYCDPNKRRPKEEVLKALVQAGVAELYDARASLPGEGIRSNRAPKLAAKQKPRNPRGGGTIPRTRNTMN